MLETEEHRATMLNISSVHSNFSADNTTLASFGSSGNCAIRFPSSVRFIFSSSAFTVVVEFTVITSEGHPIMVEFRVDEEYSCHSAERDYCASELNNTSNADKKAYCEGC
jgi:hypothetical protein